MKRCSACGSYKSESEFFKNAAMKKDGLSNQCKKCHSKSTKQYADTHRDKIREIGRIGKAKERKRDGVRLTRQKWNDWYSGAREYRNKYQRNRYDPVKRSAQNKLNKAVMYGRITRPKQCSKCDKHCKPDAHHSDYSKPLQVIWLCRSCHRLLQNK